MMEPARGYRSRAHAAGTNRRERTSSSDVSAAVACKSPAMHPTAEAGVTATTSVSSTLRPHWYSKHKSKRRDVGQAPHTPLL